MELDATWIFWRAGQGSSQCIEGVALDALRRKERELAAAMSADPRRFLSP